MRKIVAIIVLLSVVLGAQSAYAITIDTPTSGASISKPTTFSGTSKPNATVILKEDNTQIATTSADGSGNWTITTSNTTSGTHTYTAQESHISSRAFMNPRQEGRVDVLDMVTHTIDNTFYVPGERWVNDVQVVGSVVYVLTTAKDQSDCSIFTYSTSTLEQIGEGIEFATSCYSRNFDLTHDGKTASVYYIGSDEYEGHIAVIDTENATIIDDIGIGPDTSSMFNTQINSTTKRIYVIFAEQIDAYDINEGAYILSSTSYHPQNTITNGVLTDDDSRILVGTADQSLAEIPVEHLDWYSGYGTPNDGYEMENDVYLTDVQLNVVGSSPDGLHYFATGYNGENYSIWEWDKGNSTFTKTTTFDQYPESLGVTPDNEQWVVGDNHSNGYIYTGLVGQEGVTNTEITDGASYTMSTDDFFSPLEEHGSSSTISATIVGDTTNTSVNNSYGIDPLKNVASKNVAPGGSVEVSGSGYLPDSEVTLTLHSTPLHLATIKTNSSGTFNTKVTIPNNTVLGSHTIEISGTNASGSSVTSILLLNVSTLPVTGNDAQNNSLFAISLLGIGLGILFISKKIRRHNRIEISA